MGDRQEFGSGRLVGEREERSGLLPEALLAPDS